MPGVNAATAEIDAWIARLNEPSMRAEATYRLASIGVQAVPSLVAAARGIWTNRLGVPCSNDLQIRRGALIALRHLGGAAASAIPTLIELTKVHFDSVLRCEAADALAAMGSAAQTATAALEELANDYDHEVRLSARRALDAIAAST